MIFYRPYLLCREEFSSSAWYTASLRAILHIHVKIAISVVWPNYLFLTSTATTTNDAAFEYVSVLYIPIVGTAHLHFVKVRFGVTLLGILEQGPPVA